MGGFKAITVILKLWKPRCRICCVNPCEALQGFSYGQLIAKNLRQLGWWNPKPQRVVEVGGGVGLSVSRNGERIFAH